MSADAYDLRAATRFDIVEIEELLATCYPRLMASAYDSATLEATLPMMTRANAELIDSTRFHLAHARSGLLIGCGGWSLAAPGSGALEAGIGHIRHFATHPDYLYQGIGRAIFERCRAEAIAAGIKRLDCYSSLNGEPFYAAIGFSARQRCDIPMGDARLPIVSMTCPIVPRPR